jgi:ribulose-phosphate 3-epimerase
MAASPTSFMRLRQQCPTVSVGVLTADLMALGPEISILERVGVGAVHIDVMDGCFTPTMTVGPPFVRAIKTSLLKDVHLMIREPLATLGDYVAAGADIITVHVEACTHVHRVLQRLGKTPHAVDPARGIVRGIGLNPGTPLETIEPLLDEVELVVLLAVNPGWGGQSFIPSTYGRIERVRQIIGAAQADVLVSVDGGVTRDNIDEIATAGADLVVTGSAVFDGRSAAANAEFMLKTVRQDRILG